VSRWRDGLANATQANDARALAGDLARHRGRALVPLARVQPAIGLHQSATRHEHQGDRDVGHIISQHIRRVGHANAARATVVDGHAVIADAIDADDLQCGQLIKKSRRRDAAASHDNTAHSGTHFTQQHCFVSSMKANPRPHASHARVAAETRAVERFAGS